MVRVTDMVGQSYLPSGADYSTAVATANKMRGLMRMDIEEADIAKHCSLFNHETDSDDMLAAWGFLSSRERSTWKALLEIAKVRRAD